MKEKALFYRFKATADLALKSVESKKEERLKTAIGYYQNFVQKSKDEDLKAKAKKVFDKLQKTLNELQKNVATVN